eukprot:SAG11_NODE_26255_length_347_cov_1.629032_1_plen_26_part_10
MHEVFNANVHCIFFLTLDELLHYEKQ